MTLADPPLIWLPEDFHGPFPTPALALIKPDGLLAAGGNLNPETLLQAYSQGIFPWYSYDQPILWWTPNPRCVIYPENFHISRSFKRLLNKNLFEIKTNTAFREVMLACAEPRPEQSGTWIVEDMIKAYCTLHKMGKAQSIECWYEEKLVGGIYGLLLGNIFFGESMFSKKPGASKIAMHYICNTIKPVLIDCQVHSPHLETLGAEMIDREDFINKLDMHI